MFLGVPKMSKNIPKLIAELEDFLDSVTLKELTDSEELRGQLMEIQIRIGDFLKMINPKYKPFVILDKKRSNKNGS